VAVGVGVPVFEKVGVSVKDPVKLADVVWLGVWVGVLVPVCEYVADAVGLMV
jgi:hypothetical protein